MLKLDDTSAIAACASAVLTEIDALVLDETARSGARQAAIYVLQGHHLELFVLRLLSMLNRGRGRAKELAGQLRPLLGDDPTIDKVILPEEERDKPRVACTGIVVTEQNLVEVATRIAADIVSQREQAVIARAINELEDEDPMKDTSELDAIGLV